MEKANKLFTVISRHARHIPQLQEIRKGDEPDKINACATCSEMKYPLTRHDCSDHSAPWRLPGVANFAAITGMEKGLCQGR